MLGFLGGALIVLGALVNILGSGRRQKTSAQKAEA
jgi:hypothetical protein